MALYTWATVNIVGSASRPGTITVTFFSFFFTSLEQILCTIYNTVPDTSYKICNAAQPVFHVFPDIAHAFPKFVHDVFSDFQHFVKIEDVLDFLPDSVEPFFDGIPLFFNSGLYTVPDFGQLVADSWEYSLRKRFNSCP